MNHERTEAKNEASRNNGKLPHGLLSSLAVLPGEQQAQFDLILNSALLKYEPEDLGELHMVHQLAMHHWRQLRIWAMQMAAHAGEILSQEEAAPDILDRDMDWRAYAAYKAMHSDRRCVELMHRYETSFENKFHRNRKELQRLKDKRDGLDGSK